MMEDDFIPFTFKMSNFNAKFKCSQNIILSYQIGM